MLILVSAGCAEAPPGPPPAIASFGDFHPASGRDHYLACPQNYCLAVPDLVTPLTSVPADKMRFIVRRALDAQPRTELLASANEGLRLVYRQRPEFLGPGGTVTVEVVDADEGVSGIVLYSQSDGDGPAFGANRRRVHEWLAAINAAAARAAHG